MNPENECFERAFVTLSLRQRTKRDRVKKSFFVRIYKDVLYEPPKAPPKDRDSCFSPGNWIFLLDQDSSYGWWIAENAAPWRGFLSVDVLSRFRKKMNTDDQGNPLPKIEAPIIYGKTELVLPIRRKSDFSLLVPSELLPLEPEWYVGHRWRNSLQDPKRILAHLLREEVLGSFISDNQKKSGGDKNPLSVFDEMRKELSAGKKTLYLNNILLSSLSAQQEFEEEKPSEELWEDVELAFEEMEGIKPVETKPAPQPVSTENPKKESPFGFEAEFENKNLPVNPIDKITQVLVGLEEVSSSTKALIVPLLEQLEKQTSALVNLRRELEELQKNREGLKFTNVGIRRLARLLIHNPQTSEEEVKTSCELLTKAYIGKVMKEAGLSNGRLLPPEQKEEFPKEKRKIAGNIRREICDGVKKRTQIDITLLRELRNKGRKEKDRVRYVDVAHSVGLLWVYYEEVRALSVGAWGLLENPV